MVLYPEDEKFLLAVPELRHHEVPFPRNLTSPPKPHSQGEPGVNNDELAKAFSGHAFERTFPHLATDVVWNLVGQAQLKGREAVVAACRATAAETQNVSTTWLRFLSTGDGDVVAVDAVGRYEAPEGVTAVSSCDIYEFTAGTIIAITSYATEVDPDQPYSPLQP